MVYQGQLLTDCLANAEGDQCFPVGPGATLRNCSAAKKTSHSLAAILLAGSTAALDGESCGCSAARLHTGSTRALHLATALRRPAQGVKLHGQQ